MHRLPFVARCAAAALTLVAVAAGPAMAHTTANPDEAEAAGFAKIDFRVGHGCDGQPTQALAVRIPDGVVSVKPEQEPGWEADTETGELDEPVELHGEEITEGVTEVSWTAQDGSELPDDEVRDFGLSMQLPDRAGETLYFPAVQTCPDGSEIAWIEIPQEGESPDDLEEPAPSVMLTAAQDGHGGEDTDAEAETTAAETGDGETGDGETGDDETGGMAAGATGADSDVLAVVALVVGALGLATAIGSLVAVRRR